MVEFCQWDDLVSIGGSNLVHVYTLYLERDLSLVGRNLSSLVGLVVEIYQWVVHSVHPG